MIVNAAFFQKMKNTILATAFLSVLLLGCGDKDTPEGNSPDETPASKTGTKDPKEVVQGVVDAMAELDYEAFKKFTCLGMTKEQFKAFMAQNNSGKIARAWDASADDFVPAFKTSMRSAFDEALKEAMKEGFNMSNAKVDEVELTDDIKTTLTSGNARLDLHLDDCFITPQGLLMFDAIKAR